MDDAQRADIATWVTKTALAGRPEPEILSGFCERLASAGVPVARGLVFIDTLHPIHEGHVIRWTRDKEATVTGYGRTSEGEAAASWQRSPFYSLLQSKEPFLRRKLSPETVAEFSVFEEMVALGMTEYMCTINRFAPEGAIGEMDCVYSAWSTDRPGGFEDEQITSLRKLLPFLALAMKSATLGQMAETLVLTYLGRDAGRMVMNGRIARGVTDRIDTVLWFSDLRGYTRISDTAAPEQIIPLLNDYAEAIISAVHDKGGDVLKLIGDGVLAIFRADGRQSACRAAIDAAAAADTAIGELNTRRAFEGLPTTHMYLGLHVGEVYFGNIGSTDRLDFTVIGPAVNEVSRIASMCRSVDQPLLVSSAFAKSLDGVGPRLVSVGRYALRGVGAAQDLYTLDPEQG